MSEDRQRPVRIDGRPVTTAAGLDVCAPYDGQLLGSVPACGVEHVSAAVAAGRRALAEERLPTWRRAAVLDRAAELLESNAVASEFATSIALEVAKPIAAARVEVARTASTFRFAAAAARALAGEALPLDASEAGAGRLGFTLRVPVGVVAAITPFNFPLNLVAHKLAPAIAAGCPVVLKPAPQAPLTAIALVELLQDACGLPPAWLSVVTGAGSDLGQALVAHEDVAMVTFTGSPDVGWAIRAAAPRKKVALELGNNAPVIVEPDGDWRGAARRVAAAGYAHAGQSCIAVQRVLVHESVAAAFMSELADEVAALRVGDPLDERTQVSALIDTAARDRVRAWIDEAVATGARVVTGGGVTSEGVLRPTLLAGVTPDLRVSRDEVFGPLVGVATYRDLDEAFAVANDTRFGLHAGIFTASLGTARRAIEELDYGGVIVNDVPTWRADQMPYGGLRDSGNTREGPAYTVTEMTELRAAVFA